MKNIYFYYIALFAPLLILIQIFKLDMLNSWLAISLLLGYVFIYRTYIDGLRLISKNLIARRTFGK